MKNILIICLLPILSCGVKKELAESEKQKNLLELRMQQLKLKNIELEAKNQELIAENQTFSEQAKFYKNYSTNLENKVNHLRNEMEVYTERMTDANTRLDNLRNGKPENGTKSFKTKPNNKIDGVFKVVDIKPQYPGGEEKKYEFLGKTIKYPQEAKDSSVTGRVYVGFVVRKDGSLTDFKVVRGIGSGCDEEAVRALKAMPNWIPGEWNGVRVDTQMVLPIIFTLR